MPWSDNYIIKKSLGRKNGANNEGIFIVQRRGTNQTYIEKRIPAMNVEVSLLKDISHPNIIKYVDDFWRKEAGDGKTCLIIEYCHGGSLFDLIQRHQVANQFMLASLLPESFVWQVLDQIGQALRYCHYGITKDNEIPPARWNPICHRDVRTPNIFIRPRPDNSGVDVKLGDFGVVDRNHDRRMRRNDVAMLGQCLISLQALLLRLPPMWNPMVPLPGQQFYSLHLTQDITACYSSQVPSMNIPGLVKAHRPAWALRYVPILLPLHQRVDV